LKATSSIGLRGHSTREREFPRVLAISVGRETGRNARRHPRGAGVIFVRRSLSLFVVETESVRCMRIHIHVYVRHVRVRYTTTVGTNKVNTKYKSRFLTIFLSSREYWCLFFVTGYRFLLSIFPRSNQYRFGVDGGVRSDFRSKRKPIKNFDRIFSLYFFSTQFFSTRVSL